MLNVIDGIRTELLASQFLGGLMPADTCSLLITGFQPSVMVQKAAFRQYEGNMLFLFTLIETEAYLEIIHCS